ncbi:MAG: hypothetical protein IKG52_14625 [Rhodobacteraceae bacterium]|nr:hypothetical protein [Paracoccaceae bacterium]
MTDAMSRREIEDVLSSIRRLVAQDQPRQDQPAQDQTEPRQDGDTGPGKLILTSALRVPDDLPASQSAQPETVPVQTAAAQGDTPPQSPAAQPGASDDPDLAGGDGAPAATSSAVHMLRVMNQRDADQKAAASTVHGPSSGAGPSVASDTDGDVALEATLARLEHVLAQGQHPSSPAAAVAQSHDAATGVNTTPDESVIDEAMLHQIVANIVRQELQGELGERITRNIRKLVRAEVARELQLRKP